MAAGLCLGLAIVWFPAAWVTKFRAEGWLQWQATKKNRPDWANDEPLKRLRNISARMLSMWPVPVAAAVAGMVLIVMAVA